MAFTSLNSAQLTAGKPIIEDILTTTKANQDDHETRIADLETGGISKAYIFNEVIDLNLYRVGEIRFSLLTETQFQDRYGIDWALIEGQSWTGKDIGSLYGVTAPAGLGRFPRIKDASRSLGQLEANQNLSHNHTIYYEYVPTGGAVYTRALSNLAAVSDGQIPAVTTEWDATAYSMSTNGGSEARPDSLVMNAFIRESDRPAEYVKIYRAPSNVNILSATISNLEAGSSGTLELDILKGSSLGVMSTMLTSNLSLTAASGNYTTSSEASFDTSSLSQGDFLRIDIKAYQTQQERFYLNIYGESS